MTERAEQLCTFFAAHRHLFMQIGQRAVTHRLFDFERLRRCFLLFILCLTLLFGMAAVASYSQPPTWLTQKAAGQDGAEQIERDLRQGLQAFLLGLQLFMEGTPESLQKAIGQFEKLLPTWRDASVRLKGPSALLLRKMEAVTLLQIGNAYVFLGEQRKGIDYYHQTLSILQAVGDKMAQATTLNLIGAAHFMLGEKQKALDVYNRALPLWESLGNNIGEGITLFSAGQVYNFLEEDKQKALEFYNQALPIFQASGNSFYQAAIFTFTGTAYSSLGQKQKALDFYNRALPLWRSLGKRASSPPPNIWGVLLAGQQKDMDSLIKLFTQEFLYNRLEIVRSGEGITLMSIGRVYDSLGEKQKALEFYNQALLPFRDGGLKTGEATTLNHIGDVYADLGDKHQAISFYNQALPLWQAAGDRAGEALTLISIGSSQSLLGEYRGALLSYSQSLPIWRSLGNRDLEARLLAGIGMIQTMLGNQKIGLDQFNTALLLSQQLNDKSWHALSLTINGEMYSLSGEWQKALDSYNQALNILKMVSDRRTQAFALTMIGVNYISLGEKQKGLSYVRQAIPLLRKSGDRAGETLMQIFTGDVNTLLGNYQTAINHFTRARFAARAAKNRQWEAIALFNLGATAAALSRYRMALSYYNQALSLLQEIEDPIGRASTLSGIGYCYSRSGDQQKAIEAFSQALPLFQTVGNRQGEAHTLADMAAVYAALGNESDARARVDEAIRITEQLRTKVDIQDLRASYFASVQDYYEFYIDLLMQLHKKYPSENHNTTALQICERARARGLLDLLAEARADIRQGIDPALVESERTVARKLSALTVQQLRLRQGKYSHGQAEELKKEIETLTTEYQEIEAQMRRSSPRYAALSQTEPLTLPQLQQLLDPDTALLEYSLGKERSYLWAVTHNSISSYVLPKRTEIEKAARLVYDMLTARNERPGETPYQRQSRILQADARLPEVASRLSQMVLSSAAEQLGKKRLLIVSDGALQYVPFAMLPAPQAPAAEPAKVTGHNGPPLIEDHEIVNLPSASTLASLRQQLQEPGPAMKTVAILADPVFSRDDPRVRSIKTGAKEPEYPCPEENQKGQAKEDSRIFRSSDSDLLLQRLPSTQCEARKIISFVSPGEYKLALGFEANREIAMSPELAQYRIIHFATHGFFNDPHPNLSGVVLSLVDKDSKQQDGLLLLPDVYRMRLRAEMVVLSACQTALGKNVRGEGLVGLTRGFIYAGAERVVASLWKVETGATRKLMEQFYQKMLGPERMRPAAALRAAQLKLRKEKDMPYYWAGFVLQGEWK